MSSVDGTLEYVFTSDVPGILEKRGISLLVTSYQAQFIMAISSKPGGLQMTVRHFERPTGIAVGPRRIAICTRREVWLFRATGELRDLEGKIQPFDLCLAPRSCHVTGDVLAHEAAWAGDELMFVNTRFSCLASIHEDWSFVPRWMPPFVSACVPEDRCHLNGMALDEGGIRYVTAMGMTDTAEGWRAGKATDGVLLSWPDGEVVARGLAMPHSPRVHGGHLFVLDSGRGELQTVDRADGSRTALARLPGYLRGLAFHGSLAFVGLSRMREAREFGGLPIEAQRDTLECAIYIIDLTTGNALGKIQFTRGIEELFDICVIPAKNLGLMGMEGDTMAGLYVVPTSGSAGTR